MSINRLYEELEAGRINYVVLSKSKMTEGQFFSLLHSDLKSLPYHGSGSSPEEAISDALSLIGGGMPKKKSSGDLEDLLG